LNKYNIDIIEIYLTKRRVFFMNTFLKFNKNLKSQKATVILLSLFLIFFISSIIGIIYSYNKRIFSLAKQERDNYKVFKKQLDEMFSNLYMVDLIELGWQIEKIQNLDIISIPPEEKERRSSQTFRYRGESSNPTIGLSGNIDIDNDTFYLSSSGDANLPINRHPFELPSKELKIVRDNTAYKLKSEAKDEIERELKELLGNNVEILGFDEYTNNNVIDNEIKRGKTGKLKYTVTIQKNIKILQGKKEKEIKPKYKIELDYEVSITGDVEVIFPESIEYTSPITETIYDKYTGQNKEIITGYNYNNNISIEMKATLNSYSNLTEFQIKKTR
jgi:hypothetical protein